MTLQQSHRIADAVESLREAKEFVYTTEAELNNKFHSMPENIQECTLGNELIEEIDILHESWSAIEAIIEKLSPYYD